MMRSHHLMSAYGTSETQRGPRAKAGLKLEADTICARKPGKVRTHGDARHFTGPRRLKHRVWPSAGSRQFASVRGSSTHSGVGLVNGNGVGN
jgi:hypothetical protein